MTREYLELMKADLLAEYRAQLCEDSLDAIEKASTIEEFIGLLSKFSAFLNYKFIPEVWWVRKWFNNPERKDIAESNGVYFEGIHVVTNPTKPIVVMGDAQIMLTCTEPHLYRVTLQENSKCTITTFYACAVNVRQKGNSECKVLHKHNMSNIKIRKV